MKRFFALILVAVFCFALSLTSMASGYTISDNGDAVYSTAVGYTFRIDDINGKISGEDSTICTDSQALVDQGSKYAIWFKAIKVSKNVYKATTKGTAMGGNLPEVAVEEDEIVFVIHSSTSNPDNASSYPNWEDKVAALAVAEGDYFILEGINIASCSGSGSAKCVSEAEGEAYAEEENAKGEEESSEEESSVEPSDEPDESIPEETAESLSSEENTSTDIITSEMEIGTGFPKWLIGVIVAAVVIIACIVIITVNKKKSK